MLKDLLSNGWQQREMKGLRIRKHKIIDQVLLTGQADRRERQSLTMVVVLDLQNLDVLL